MFLIFQPAGLLFWFTLTTPILGSFQQKIKAQKLTSHYLQPAGECSGTKEPDISLRSW